MKMMKIGLLHYTAPPVVGGVEAILAKHVLLMTEAGHQVCVIAGRGAQFDPRIPFHHVPIVDSVQSDVLLRKTELDQGKVSPEFDLLVAKITSSIDPLLHDLDLLMAHNVCSLHKNLALTAALRKYAERPNRAALVLWHHDFAWTAARYRSELHDGYPWNLIRQDWPRTTQVVVSEFRRREMAELFGMPLDRIRVVPNGVDITNVLALNANTVELAERLHLLSASPLILLPVRITQRKNIELAIRTVAELRKRFPDVLLIITGPPGPHNVANQQYYARIKSLREELSLQSSVHLVTEIVPEYLPDEVIFGLYRLADLLLLPSVEEGFGLPIIEASQARLPIFCSDIAPLRELAMDQANYFSPESAPEEIGAKIEAYLQASVVYQLRTRLRMYEWSRVYKEVIAPLLSEAVEGL